MRSIIHVDMDAFYAAVEQLDRPELRGRPVVVGGLGRRGVVSTASYEARPFGVRSAMPTARARQLCPDAIFLTPRMERYVEVSRHVFGVLGEFTPQIEGLSLDEAFLDVSASLTLFGSMATIGAGIKRRVLAETGLRCSVGLSHNKLLAKLATELGKPDGLFAIEAGEEARVLDPLPVSRLWTVGKVAAAKLERYDITTIGALRAAPPALLQRLLGSHGATLTRLARGEDERDVVVAREEKSVGAEHTFDVDLQALADARSWLLRLAERVGERARRQGLSGRTVTVKLRVPPFETMTRQGTLQQASAATADVYALADRLLETWWKERRAPALRLLGVSLSGFDAAAAPAQPVLFGTATPPREDRLLDRINDRFGGGAIRRARTLATDKPE